jgi:outer membrane receptor protein involved in Fe transport
MVNFILGEEQRMIANINTKPIAGTVIPGLAARKQKQLILAAQSIALAALSLLFTQAWAEDAGTAARQNVIEEVIVTAQKREQSVLDIGMSIDAASGEHLQNLGITDAADLYKVVSGFSSNVTQAGTPIYTIRGIGFQETSLATSPTVSVYLDEMPMQFAPMTRGASLDVARVEALKGPQGTLFGQNATGGAVNFIANKPTQEFEAGVNASYGRFAEMDLNGYISGPINDAWSYRVAARIQQSDDWQKSYVTGDEAGEQDETAYRVALAYDNDERLSALITLTGFTDESDTLRPQLAGKVAQNPVNGLPPGFITVPLAPNNPRDADWSPCTNANGGTPENPNTRSWSDCAASANDTDYFSAHLRVDFDLTENILLTSLTSYSDFDRKGSGVDQDGTQFQIYETLQQGTLESRFQEFRLSGNLDGMGNSGTWVVGVNYEHTETYDQFLQSYGHSSVVPVFGFIDFGPGLPNNAQEADTYAIFANLEYELNEDVTLQAGVRYTDQERDFVGCTNDGGDGTWSLTSFLIQPFLGSENPVLPDPGECGTTGVAPDFNPVVGGHKGSLNEDNTSWRLGVNWAVNDATLTYANVSKGYKNGQFPTLPGSAVIQLIPVVQEELLAYEVGVKTTLLDGSLQFNGAVFYYDYTDKQVRGALEDSIFGSLPALVNVPESHVTGFEMTATWLPIDGLRITPSVSFADTEVDGTFRNFDAFFKPGVNAGTKDFSGQDFPHAPETTANLDISYSWEVMDGWTAFVGTNVNYQDETTSFFVDECKEPGVPCTATDAELLSGDSDLPIPDRTLVDLRAGIERGQWKIWAWGRNVTGEYYWTRHSKVNDSIVRLAGKPETYGITVSYTN